MASRGPLQHVFVTERDDALEITVGGSARESEGLSAAITVSAQAGRGDVLASAIAEAMRAAARPAPPVEVVRVRTRKRALALVESAPKIEDKVVLVPVTARNARWLLAIVAAVRSAKPLGVQLVWDGTHDRERIFEVLERARSTPQLCSVFVAKTEAPCFALRSHAERRKETPRC